MHFAASLTLCSTVCRVVYTIPSLSIFSKRTYGQHTEQQQAVFAAQCSLHLVADPKTQCAESGYSNYFFESEITYCPIIAVLYSHAVLLCSVYCCHYLLPDVISECPLDTRNCSDYLIPVLLVLYSLSSLCIYCLHPPLPPPLSQIVTIISIVLQNGCAYLWPIDSAKALMCQ